MGYEYNYQVLAMAVAEKAADDWKCAKKMLRRNPRNSKAETLLYDAERFFRLEWCYAIGGVDGRYILRRLQEEWKA